MRTFAKAILLFFLILFLPELSFAGKGGTISLSDPSVSGCQKSQQKLSFRAKREIFRRDGLSHNSYFFNRLKYVFRKIPPGACPEQRRRGRNDKIEAFGTAPIKGGLATISESLFDLEASNLPYLPYGGFEMNYPLLSPPPQENGDIRVDAIEPKLSNDTLKVSAIFMNLFSRKIIGTIQSGLPSIIQIEIKLTDLGNKNIVHTLISRTIEYDIWEEQYSVEWADTILTYSNFDKVMETCGQLQSKALTQIGALNTRLKYVVQMRVAIIPITTKQADKVSSWLLNPNQTEESLASQNRASGFKMNLNKLVSFFLGSKKKSRYSSEWRSSKPFTPIDLKP